MRLLGAALFWLVFLALISLGVWQVQRLQWKESLLITMAEKSQQAPALLYDRLGEIEHATVLYEPVSITAPPLCDKLMFIGLRQYEQVPGYHVIVPFKINGGYLLANLGWLNASNQPDWGLPQAFCNKPQTLSGVMVRGDRANMFSGAVAGQVSGNIWRSVEVDAIAEAYDLHPVLPGVLRQTDFAMAGLVPLPKTISLPNRHLEYAGTWFAFTAVWGVIGWLRWRV